MKKLRKLIDNLRMVRTKGYVRRRMQKLMVEDPIPDSLDPVEDVIAGAEVQKFSQGPEIREMMENAEKWRWWKL